MNTMNSTSPRILSNTKSKKGNAMKLNATVLMVLASIFATSALAREEYSRERQEELDEICEMEREKLKAPLRREAIEECVERNKRNRDAGDHDRAYCERYFESYGDGGPASKAMFYDLPQCVEAFDYRRSKNQRF